ncbi:reverse transcriptase domain-containing protein [Roseateles sp. DXS20W]|uniref:RNA-directed DNA polymerase n=1 Tax=Pelomonas lactea TaxID=3299030 RepID=A0ABW7GNP7_9BURK
MDRAADTLERLPTLNEWKSHFRSRGIRPELSKEYVSYIKPLVKKGVPVIFDFRHLCELLGRTPHFLGRATCAPSYFYRTFRIPKRSGGLREISSPYPSLKECQRWIAHQIVSRLASHPAATAYKAGTSILSNVQPHLGEASHVLIVDIKDFFPSISKKRLVGWFASLGYNYEVSVALASLCTLNGHLPQGSPASPYLSNALCRTLDNRLSSIASSFGLAYTRYADDMCFSGAYIPPSLLPLVESVVSQSGFALNRKKTRLARPSATSKVVTGVNIASGTPRLPKGRRRHLAHLMHFIERFGYLSHKAKLKSSDAKYLLRLRGQLEYWRMIEPDNQQVGRYIAHVTQLQIIHGDG